MPAVRPTRQTPLEPEQTIFLLYPHQTHASAAHSELKDLVNRYAPTIASRWRKKKTALRAKSVSRAWSVARGPDAHPLPQSTFNLSKTLFEAARASTDPLASVPLEDLLYSPFNLETLSSTPAPLLHLIAARSRHQPCEFGRSDYLTTIKPTLQLFGRLPEDEHSYVASEGEGQMRQAVILQNDPSRYGKLKSWGSTSDDYLLATRRNLVCNLLPEGLALFSWQKVIVEFCLACVKDILLSDGHGLPPALDGGLSDTLLNGVSELRIAGSSSTNSYAASSLETYTGPAAFDLPAIHRIAVTNLRQAEDHLDLLRSEPSYLLQRLESALEYRAEHLRDTRGLKGSIRSPECVADAVKKIIHNAYSRMVIWNEVVILLEDAELLSHGGTRPNPIVDDKLNAVSLFLEQRITTIYNDFKLHLPGGPQFRHLFIRVQTDSLVGKMAISRVPDVTCSSLYDQDPIAGLLMTLLEPSPRWESKVFTLKRFWEEMERILAEHPELRDHVPPWVMERLSTAAQVLEMVHVLQNHVPSIESSYFDGVMAFTEFAETLNQFAAVFPEVDLSPMLGIGASSDAGMVRLLRICRPDGDSESELGYQQFWALVDDNVARLGDGLSLSEWSGGTKKRLAKRRKGRWRWQGRVWFVEEADAMMIETDDDEEPPELLSGLVTDVEEADEYGGFDLSSVGENQTRLQSTQRSTEMLPGLRGAFNKTAKSEGKSGVGTASTASRSESENTAPPATAGAKSAEKPRKLGTKPPQPLDEILAEQPFGVRADGATGPEEAPLLARKPKTKTRKAVTTDLDPSEASNRSVEPIPTDATENAEQAIPVTRRVFKTLALLSSGVPTAWKEFLHAMGKLGFRTEPVGGSVVRFVPADGEDEPINFHRPHPGSVLGRFQALWIWRRLKRSYGWDIGRFQERE